MQKEKSFYEYIVELRRTNKIPKQWRVADIKPFLKDHFSKNTIIVYPSNCSISVDGKIKGDYVKKGQKPKFYRVRRGSFEIINDSHPPTQNKATLYMDLFKAHELFKKIEKRWVFYDVYIKRRDRSVWMASENLPIREGLLLFGFIQSWDPYFQGDLDKFLTIYREIFSIIKKFEHANIADVTLNNEAKHSIQLMFEKIAKCPRNNRFESTDASKILHTILPELFVMWDNKIRKEIFGGDKRDGKCYAFEFLPKMQDMAKGILNSYISEEGGDFESASQQISKTLDNYTLAKLIDEYNYVRYTKQQKV